MSRNIALITGVTGQDGSYLSEFLLEKALRQQVAYAVNCMLTARYWFIGFFIVEFERHGADRAQYVEQLLKVLAKRINRRGMT